MFAQQRPHSAGPEVQAPEPHRWSSAPVPAEVSLRRSRGGLEVIPGGYRAARGGSPPPQRDAQPGHQLVHVERLGDVVVCACVEGGDLLDLGGTRGQHETGMVLQPRIRVSTSIPPMSGRPRSRMTMSAACCSMRFSAWPPVVASFTS